MTKEDLKDYLVDEAEYSICEVEDMGPWDLVSNWCDYEGLIGYDEKITDVVFAAYEDISVDMTFNDLDEDEQPNKLADLYESMSEEKREEFLKLIGK